MGLYPVARHCLLQIGAEFQEILMPPRLSCHPVRVEAPMDAWTIGLLVAFDGYVAFRLVQGWKGIQAFGPLMVAGVAASLAAVALGQVGIVGGDQSYQTYMVLAASLSAMLVIAAIWRGYKPPRRPGD
jgi:hypothetical protein